jgi:hypothetical protein
MIRTGFRKPLVLTALLGIFLTGCGGGGETTQTSASPAPSVTTLSWNPPSTYEDNSVLDPYQALDYYEIYLRTADPNFTDNEAPVAQVAAVTDVLAQDGVTHNFVLTNDFTLSNLLPFAQPGAVHYLSIKSVSVDGLKSDFSTPVVWDLT